VRILQLTEPPEHGDDVRAVQKLLGLPPTGNYDQSVANAVYRRKLMLGYQTPDHSAGDLLVAYLKGAKKPTPAMVARAAAYKKRISGQGGTTTRPPNQKPKPADNRAAHEAAVRANTVSLMQLLLAQTARVHYPVNDQRTRTIHQIATRAQLQTELTAGRLNIDCSQAVTLIAHVAGAKDPNGGNYASDGFTGTLLQHCAHISRAQAQHGDLCVFGGGTGHHVTMVMQPGGDPLLFSHGQENDPIAIRQSVEGRFQPPGITYLRLPI
jgi:hypothetical protein